MYKESDFIPKTSSNIIENGKFKWTAPSNIALIKYWGKKENQLPRNPSLSFTLNYCKTSTTLCFNNRNNFSKQYLNNNNFSFDLFFDGILKEDFKPKIQQFLERIEIYLPFLKEYHFKIDTKNTFPHSSGIASSASGIAALTMNLMSLEKKINPSMTNEYFYQKASFLARLGSGSACRSITGKMVVWGEHNKIKGSSNLFGIEYPYPVHENFKNFQDIVLLVDKGEKKVSSTLGHNLMNNHPFANNRFNQAHKNLDELISVFKNGDLDLFIKIIENEALTLHAMMMCSMPYFILMKPNTLNIINAIWNYRNETKIPVCFTLDAGANVHLLFPKKFKEVVLKFITNELATFCQNRQFICDEIGNGVEEFSI